MNPYFRKYYRPKNKSWKSEQTIGINSFGGGMNNVSADNVIADNECSDCKNMMFLSSTHMQKRYGTSKYDDVNYPDLDDDIVWIDEYKPLLSDSKIIRATSTKVYVDNTEICDVAGKIRGVNYIGKYYFVDGQKLRYWDGSNVYIVTNAPLSFLNETVSISSGATTKTFNFEKKPVQLQVNDPVFILSSSVGLENDVNGTVTSVTLKNDGTYDVVVTFSSALSSDVSIEKNQPIFFYVPLALKYTEGEYKTNIINNVKYAWYEPCTMQLADTYTGAGYLPNNPNLITIHKNRLFVSGDNEQPNAVFMSWVNNPLWFPSNSYVSVKPNGEKIIDLIVFDDALIIGRHEDIFVLYGSSVYATSDDYFYIKQMDVSTGFMCTDCGSLLNNFYIFLGYDGRFYKLNTPTTFVEYLMTRPLDKKIDIYSPPFNVTSGASLIMSSVSFYNEIYFNLFDDMMLVYNYDNMAWTYYTGMKSSCLYSDGNNLLIGTVDGELCKYEYQSEVFSDCGAAIKCLYATKRYDFNSPVNFKYFKSFIISSHVWNNLLSNINVKTEVDYYEYCLNESIFPSNFPRFGISKWGQIHFNKNNLAKTNWYNLDIKGRTIKFTFSNENNNEPLRIYDLFLLCTLRDVR